MFSLLKYQRYRGYWKLRHYINSIKFYIYRFSFKRKEQIKQSKENIVIYKELTRIVAPSFFFAILIVATLEFIEFSLFEIAATLESNYQFAEKFLAYQNILSARLIKSPDSLVNLLSLIASLSGILLGLYFTAISVVASTVFATVPSNLRNLLCKRKIWQPIY